MGTYIRSPPNNNPVKDLSGSDVACNVNNVAVPKTLNVASGDVITFECEYLDGLDC
jgi:lytic cellulose monooxygenase (C1-hydroxylating)